MASKLEEIIAAARARVRESTPTADVRALERRAANHQPRGFRDHLLKTSKSGPAIIAELKKASPSKGLIRADFPVATLAKDLANAGAAALSVLTDERYFQGSLHNLELASEAASLPCLRKDFIVDEFQLLEAKANGADAVLLILSALDDSEFSRLRQRSHQLSLDALCEVHDESELQRALNLGAEIIGVNNRDLRTFAVDMETSERLAPKIPPGVLRIAESGIKCGDDIRRLRACGYNAFLVGESLMRADDPGAELEKMLAEARFPET